MVTYILMYIHGLLPVCSFQLAEEILAQYGESGTNGSVSLESLSS